ncbi:unnamed protein product [Moneuplotes crassus]|uniref:Uncharacterized protein n=1 Tax=Euplotes crassus TaxID=5936 RepID=A0AAD1Y637_EUPCR|nr:unnamed protein product [Moneuplotes crassus]
MSSHQEIIANKRFDSIQESNQEASLVESDLSGYNTPKFNKSSTVNTAMTSTALTFSRSQNNNETNHLEQNFQHFESLKNLDKEEQLPPEALVDFQRQINVGHKPQTKEGKIFSPSSRKQRFETCNVNQKCLEAPITARNNVIVPEFHLSKPKFKKLLRVKSNDSLIPPKMKKFISIDKIKLSQEDPEKFFKENSKPLGKKMEEGDNSKFRLSRQFMDFLSASEFNNKCSIHPGTHRSRDKNQKTTGANGSYLKNSMKLKLPMKPSGSSKHNIAGSSQRKCTLLSKIYPKEAQLEHSRKKPHRTRSHDPTSCMRIRGSIQVEENTQKFSIDFKPRTNSERRKRIRTDANVIKPNFLPKIHSQRTLIIPKEKKLKCNKIKLMNLNFQEKLKRNQDGKPEIVMEPHFQSALFNILPPGTPFDSHMVLSPMMSKMCSPERNSFADSCAKVSKCMRTNEKNIMMKQFSEKKPPLRDQRYPSTRVSRKMSSRNLKHHEKYRFDAFSQEAKEPLNRIESNGSLLRNSRFSYSHNTVRQESTQNPQQAQKTQKFENPFNVHKKKPKIMIKLLSKKMMKKKSG